MKGKLYRRIQDGCIYEVIGQAGNYGSSRRWLVWNKKFSERRIVLEVELVRQVGWELIETTRSSIV